MGMLYRVDPETAKQAAALAIMEIRNRKRTQAAALVAKPLYEWQVPPTTPWDVWLLLGGRGSGKTEAGTRYVNDHANGPACVEGKTPHRIAIVAPSHDDAVNTCVRGETGLLRMNSMIRFRPGASLSAALTWPNGAEAELFGTFAPEDVERFRGPQHCLIWGDEFAAWRKLEESWDLMQPGLRLGAHPKIMLTTTPKRRALLRRIMDEPTTEVTRGKTSEATGLPPERVAALYARYGGTTMGRQELDAEIIDDVDGALWTRAMIVYGQPPKVYPMGVETPDFVRVVVGVDPNVSEGNDAAGIVVDALGTDGKGYTLADYTTDGGPNVWAKEVVRAYQDFSADRIVAEANNGGDLVSTVIRIHDKDVPITLVHASRGKRTRAEPVSALYEQGKWVHVGPMPALEDEMCAFTGASGEDSPDRMDAHVWAASDLFNIRVDDNRVWGAGPVWGAA